MINDAERYVLEFAKGLVILVPICAGLFHLSEKIEQGALRQAEKEERESILAYQTAFRFDRNGNVRYYEEPAYRG